MARVVCPNCKNEVDETAERCPHCGYDLSASTEGAEARPPGDPSRPEEQDRLERHEVEGLDSERARTEPTGEAPEDEEPVVRPMEEAPAPRARGLQWSPVLTGFAVFLVGGYLLQFLFAPTVASIVSLGGGMAVAASMARHRKFLHAALVFVVYFLLSLIVTLVAAPPGGGAGGP